MRVALVVGLAYVAVVVAAPEWRHTARFLLARTPWRPIWRNGFTAFPTSRWRGMAAALGVPLAWCFATMMTAAFIVALVGIEVVLSPKAICCSIVHLSRWLRRSKPPGGPPPCVGASDGRALLVVIVTALVATTAPGQAVTPRAPQQPRYPLASRPFGRPDPSGQIKASTDVRWLQQVALSEALAIELTGTRRRPRPRDVRAAAYLRLGEIGTVESVTAIKAIERKLSAISLVPSTVKVDAWPMAPAHYQEFPIRPLAESVAPDGTAYRVVYWHLLGPSSLFLTWSRTPTDRNSWNRPLLIEHDVPPPARSSDFALTWKDPQTAVLHYVAARDQPQDIVIALADVRRDTDGDGWTDAEERRLGLNPRLADSDGDGIPDGRDTCPLLPKPSHVDDVAAAVQRVFLLAYGFSGSRDALFVTPDTQPVHLFGYGGPILFGRAIPLRGGGRGATYVSWKIVSQSADEIVVAMSDWEDVLGAAGAQYVVKKVQAEWIVVGIGPGWVS